MTDRAMASSVDPFEPPGAIEPGAVDDPYPFLAAARRKGPVRTEWPLPLDEDPPAEPSFCVLGYDEAVAVLRDHETFSSRLMSEIMGPMFAQTIIAMDEPEHRAHRALVAPAFRPKLLARWEQTLVRRVVDELIDSFASGESADLVRRLTFAFPARVIARILGLPEQDTHNSFSGGRSTSSASSSTGIAGSQRCTNCMTTSPDRCSSVAPSLAMI